MDNINRVKNKVCTGIPEFDISPNEPLIFDKIAIFDTDRIKFYLRDGKLYNYCDFDLKSVYADSERRHFDIQLVFKPIYINTTYDLDMNLLIPIVHKGLVEIMTGKIIDFTLKEKFGEKATSFSIKEYYFVLLKLTICIFFCSQHRIEGKLGPKSNNQTRQKTNICVESKFQL